MQVTLNGGPADGMTVERSVRGGGAINVTGHGVDAGQAARYSPTRDKAVYQFRGMAKVLATLPLPERDEEATCPPS